MGSGLTLLGVTSPAVEQEDLSTSLLSDDGTWSWFSDPRGEYRNGAFYTGYIRSNGDVVIAKLDLSTDEWEEFVLSAALEVDDHNNPAFVFRSDGKLIAFYSSHNDSTHRYRISTNAEDISAWGAEQTMAGETLGSYANSWRLSSEDRIYAFWRGAGFVPKINYTDDDGATWVGNQILFDTSGRPYVKYASNGVDQIHFWSSFGHPGDEAAGTNDLYHWYYDAGDASFHKSDGTVIKTLADLMVGGVGDALEPADVTKVYDATDDKGTATSGNGWTWSIELDGSDNPVVSYTITSAADDLRYCVAYWDGAQWVKRQNLLEDVSSLYGTGATAQPDYAGGIMLDPSDPLGRAYVSHKVSGQWELYLWESTDNWQTFDETAITSGSSVKNFRPFCPKDPPAGAPKVIWCRGESGAPNGGYTSYTSYDTDIWCSPQVTRLFAPINQVAPVVSGTPSPGEVLTVSDGTWLASPSPTFSYQWQADSGGGFANITGETANTYTVDAGDVGADVRCVVTATNSQGAVSANSNSLEVTAAGDVLHDAILALSPVRYFRMNESSGPLNDYGSANQDLTDVGDPAYGQLGGVPSASGDTAVTYDATDDSSRSSGTGGCVSDTGASTPISWTRILVVKFDTSATTGHYVMSEGYSGSTNEIVGINIFNNLGHFQANFRNGNNNQGTQLQATATDYRNQWMFLMHRNDVSGDDASLWKEGTELASATSTAHAPVAGNGMRCDQFALTGLWRTSHANFAAATVQYAASFNYALSDAQWLELVDAYNGV